MELADSIRNRRHCSPEILTEHLQQALHALNTALNSQPRLFLGRNSVPTTTRQKTLKQLSNPKPEAEKRVLRPSLSKLTITTLEFSEALPFAGFAALLVELVARLDLVIEEVEELGRVACFKEFKHGEDHVILNVDKRTPTEIHVSNFAAAE